MQDVVLRKLTEGIFKDYDTLIKNSPEKIIESLLLRYGSLPWVLKILSTKLPESTINQMIEYANQEQLVEH